MSYITIKVYSFECDWPGCTEDPWEAIQPTLRDALRELRAKGWTVDLRHGKPQFCPAHDTANGTNRQTEE